MYLIYQHSCITLSMYPLVVYGSNSIQRAYFNAVIPKTRQGRQRPPTATDRVFVCIPTLSLSTLPGLNFAFDFSMARCVRNGDYSGGR